MRVHDAGDSVVVYVSVALFHVFDCSDGFFFGFVREHRAECAVAYYADVREFGSVLFVDYEAAFVVDFEADIFETETGGVGAAADGYEDDVCVELVGIVSLDALDGLRWGGWLTVSSFPPFAASTLSLTPSPLASPSSTLVLSLNFMPCFSNIFFVVFEISASMPGPPIWPRNSTTVTSDPNLDHTEPCVHKVSTLCEDHILR